MKVLVCLCIVLALAGVAIADVNVTGKWSGSFQITRDGGESKDSTAVLMLKQNGTDITGSVGPNEDEQFTIKSGKMEGSKITLEAEQDGHSLHFDLVLSSDHITGDVKMSAPNGESGKAKLDVTRAK